MSPQLDMPDNYPWLPGSSRSPLADLGELAVRLGSPVIYDRRGEVVWWDDGRWGTAPWGTDGNGTGTAVAAVTTKPLLSPYAIELTAGSTGQFTASIERYLALPENGKWGVEVAVAFITTFSYLSVAVSRFDGTNQHRAVAKVDWDNQQLSINTSGAIYTKVDDLSLPWNGNGLYHRLKLVCDNDADLYDLLSYDYEEHALSAYPMIVQAVAVSPCWRLTLTLVGHSGSNRKAQVGCVILTANEP